MEMFLKLTILTINFFDMQNKILFLILAISIFSCGKREAATKEQEAMVKNQLKIDSVFRLNHVIGLGRIEPSDKMTTINSEVEGFVKEVRYIENQKISKGQILLILDSEVEGAQLNQSKSKIASQESSIAAAKSNADVLRVKISQAKNTLERNSKLLAGNAATQQVVDDSKFALQDLEKQLSQALNNVNQQESRLNELKSDINYFQVLSTRKMVRAPRNGTFLSQDIKPGQFVSKTSSLGDFAPEGPIQAICEIDELFANRMTVGQEAEIRLQGTTEVLTKGSLQYVAPYLKKKSLFSDRADNLEDRRIREIRIKLDDPSKVLIGQRVEVVVNIQK
jgi:HlyD family secretion protein